MVVPWAEPPVLPEGVIDCGVFLRTNNVIDPSYWRVTDSSILPKDVKKGRFTWPSNPEHVLVTTDAALSSNGTQAGYGSASRRVEVIDTVERFGTIPFGNFPPIIKEKIEDYYYHMFDEDREEKHLASKNIAIHELLGILFGLEMEIHERISDPNRDHLNLKMKSDSKYCVDFLNGGRLDVFVDKCKLEGEDDESEAQTLKNQILGLVDYWFGAVHVRSKDRFILLHAPSYKNMVADFLSRLRVGFDAGVIYKCSRADTPLPHTLVNSARLSSVSPALQYVAKRDREDIQPEFLSIPDAYWPLFRT